MLKRKIIMRTIYYLFTVLLLAGCFKDKGNYKYSELDAMEITLPFPSYEVGAGKQLIIEPNVETAIPESDIEWQWDIEFQSPTDYKRFDKFAEGKKLDHVFSLSPLIPSTGTYSIRLHARQKSSDREFYSPIVMLRITSQYTGLMVLHGDDTQSDIGLLQAADFRVTEGVMETSVIPDLYSAANNNQKIPGKGGTVVQTVTSYMYDINGARVVALTDEGAAWINYADFSNIGDWNSMFMPGVNQGQPQFIIPQGQAVYAVDGGQLFGRVNSMYEVFPKPLPAAEGYNVASPFYEVGVNARVQGFCFEKDTRGFVECTNIGNFYYYADKVMSGVSQIVTSRDFNLAAMNADLIYVDRGGREGHYMAVMKQDDGSKYLAEIDWTAAIDADMSYARYDLQVLPNFNDAKFHAFGDNQVAMCYYATGSKVYRYTANNGESLVGRSNELRLQNGGSIVFDGEITMMKILKPNKNLDGPLAVDYYNYNKIMLVGVYKNNQGTIYSLKLDEPTGDVISYTTYNGFNKIYDADIKGL
ncbi:MAG: PKD-like family lipoprotein [Pseudobacter sp.]|uniref:PKD-like family lipoprotein n=1 Tax=Pseudobacter sp. TaxID=2045420 RepID=UPI003F7EE395